MNQIRLALAGALAFTLAQAVQVTIGKHNFTLPDGFTIELASGTNLAPRPIEADFDERGRLYVTDSSGSNDKVEKQLVEKPHRVLRLEDTDGDGRFDKSTTFADHMMFPEGAMWLNGSLYVAAPPSIWKLTDTNNDGVADVREEWFKGKTLTGCANDLHGPYLGPDGWIYWCKGAFAKQTYTLANGKEFTTRASHIFRARPDGTGIEPIMTGGMDNPVGLAFTPEGEIILSGTFFQHPEGGKRDGLIHAIYGGVYGKIHDVLDGHVRTGELLPIMTHLGPAAPCGIVRLESRTLGNAFENNLLVCNFNLHKVTRHVLEHEGATFTTSDSDFLVSDNPDFHPTDVLEDADGSVLVIDTGGWYKLCCPTSQLYKPDVFGAIYRIRRTGAPKIADSRGDKLPWTNITAARLVVRLEDERPAVRARAMAALSAMGDAAVYSLEEPAHNPMETARKRQNAVWTLARIPGQAARNAVAKYLENTEQPPVRQTALHMTSLWRDSREVKRLAGMVARAPLPIARAAAEALGRCATNTAAGELANAVAQRRQVSDRTLEHSIAYAMIELHDADALRSANRTNSVAAHRASLIALDQMGALQPQEVLPLLASSTLSLKQAASWIVSHHPDWGDTVSDLFAPQLRNLSAEKRDGVQGQLELFARHPAVQDLLVNTLRTGNATARAVALQVLARSGLKQMPATWIGPVLTSLSLGKPDEVAATIALIRSVPPAKESASDVNDALVATAERSELASSARMAAAAAVGGGSRQLSEPLFSRLVATLVGGATVSERNDAAVALSRAHLSNARLIELAGHAKRVGPMELPKILPAFARSTNEMVGLRLFDSLAQSKAAKSLRPEQLKQFTTNAPPSVRKRAEEFGAALDTDSAQQAKHVNELLASLKGGDIRRGQALFNSAKTACSSCHAIGYLGGNVGPDLTRIGQIRNERDLLEALVYPSASFVRSYEPAIVSTKSGDEFSGIVKKDSPDEVVLITGPNAEQRIARGEVADMRPGNVSVMPAGLADQLTSEEIADLLAFLKATRW